MQINEIQYYEFYQIIPVNSLIEKLAAVEVQLLTLERFGCKKEGKITQLTWLICLEKLILDSFYYKTPVYLVNFSNNAHYWHFIKYINLLNIIKQTKLPSKYLYILINSIEYGHKGNKRLTVYTKTYRTGYISIPTATGTRCLYHGHIWHTLGRVPADSREFIQMGTLKIISF